MSNPITIEVTPALKNWVVERCYKSPPLVVDDVVILQKLKSMIEDGSLDAQTLRSLLEEDSNMAAPSPKQVFGGSGRSGVNVLSPSKMYSDVKYRARHNRTKETMFDADGNEVEHASQREYGMVGALIKRLMQKAGVQQCVMSEHETALLQECINEVPFAGEIGGEYYDGSEKRVEPTRIKALLDDNVSAGIEAAPIFFDTQVVEQPTLSGEVWPFTNRKDVSRGRRIEAATVGAVSINSGGADAQEIALFNTANLIGSLDTTIFATDFAIEIGRDFASDAAINIGRTVSNEISKAAMAWLDEQCLIGDGVSEPTGILTAGGTTSVSFGGVTPTEDNIESWLFSVPKAQRGPMSSNRTRFISNETSYRRIRAVAVGAADQRRIHGMDLESFSLLGRPYSIVTALANTQGAFGNLSDYWSYIRKGMGLEIHTQGDYLARRNLMLIVARGRFGGQPALASSFGVVTNFLA